MVKRNLLEAVGQLKTGLTAADLRGHRGMQNAKLKMQKCGRKARSSILPFLHL
jgi:hypothetical protein